MGPGTDQWFDQNRDLLLWLVERGFYTTAQFASEYLIEAAEAAGQTVQVYIAAYSETAVWNSIRAMGPVYLTQLLIKGIPLAVAKRMMLKRLDGAIYRHVYNGARRTIHNTADRNSSITAWRRVSTTGTPCAFCALMISRGAVYKSEQSAEGQRSSIRYVGNGYHDWDKCTAEIIFRGQTVKETDQEVIFDKLYKEFAKNKSNPLSAFREAYAEYVKNNPGG